MVADRAGDAAAGSGAGGGGGGGGGGWTASCGAACRRAPPAALFAARRRQRRPTCSRRVRRAAGSSTSAASQLRAAGAGAMATGRSRRAAFTPRRSPRSPCRRASSLVASRRRLATRRPIARSASLHTPQMYEVAPRGRRPAAPSVSCARSSSFDAAAANLPPTLELRFIKAEDALQPRPGASAPGAPARASLVRHAPTASCARSSTSSPTSSASARWRGWCSATATSSS